MGSCFYNLSSYALHLTHVAPPIKWYGQFEFQNVCNLQILSFYFLSLRNEWVLIFRKIEKTEDSSLCLIKRWGLFLNNNGFGLLVAQSHVLSNLNVQNSFPHPDVSLMSWVAIPKTQSHHWLKILGVEGQHIQKLPDILVIFLKKQLVLVE